MVTLTVRALDAETDAPIGAFALDGVTVNVSIVVLPVALPSPGGSTASQMLAALAEDSNNGPLAVGGPDDKPVTGTPNFAQYSGYLAGLPRIYRIPDIGLELDLGLVVGDTGGWWIGVLPAAGNDAYEFEPVLFFVAEDLEVGVYGYKRDLTPLAREVLSLRAKAKAELAKLAPEWGGSVTSVPWAVLSMVHNYVENGLGAKDPRLQEHWINQFSWAVMDFAVPAREFDLLVERWHRIFLILGTIPYPDLAYFSDCAEGIPVTIGKNGAPLTITNYRLCVPSFSEYFPREDDQIRVDLAVVWLAGGNFDLIVACIVKHIANTAARMEKKARMLKIISVVAPILIMPNPATIITTVANLAAQEYLKNQEWYVSVIFNLAVGAAVTLLGGGVAVGAGLETELIKGVWEGSMKLVQQVIASGGATDVAQLAKDTAKLAELNGQPKEQGALEAAAEVLGSMSETEVAALFKAVNEGASFQVFIQMILETKTLPPPLIPWLAWCVGHSGMGVLLAGVFELAKQIGALLNSAWAGMGTVNPQDDVTFPLVAAANAGGVEIPAETLSVLNGDNPAFPQQAAPPGAGVGGAIAFGGTAAFIAAIGYLAKVGILR